MLNVPLLWQGDRPDCLPTCVEMVLRFHAIQTDAADIRRLLGTTDFGTPFSNLEKLNTIGVSIQCAEGRSEKVLQDAIALGLPAICGVQTGWLPYWEEQAPHSVVVVEIADDYVILLDPGQADTPHHVPFDSFMAAWIERDCQYAIIRPR